MSTNETAIGFESTQQAQIAAALQISFGQLFGLSAAEIDIHASFLELGADSLALLRASQTIQEQFGVKVPFRMLLEELSTIADLAIYLAHELPEAAPLTAEAATQIAAEHVAGNGHAASHQAPPTVEASAANPLPAKPAWAATAAEELPDGDSLERTCARQ